MNERIKQAFENRGITAYKAGQDIGIGRSLLGKYMSGDSEPSVSNIKLIAEYLNISLEWLITGKGNMDNNTPILSEEKIKGAIPYYADLPISAGQEGLTQTSQEEKPTGYMLIPNVSAEGIFPVIGCSMLPKIKAGDVIGVNRVNRWERVEPDKIYMIITNEERMIKRLRIDNEDDSILWCVSENYHEFKIYKNDIVNIFHVVYHGELL